MSNPFDEESKHPSGGVIRQAKAPSPIERNPDKNMKNQPKTKVGNLYNVVESTENSIDKTQPEKKIVATDPEDDVAATRFYVSRRVYGYPYSSGTVLSNYIHYVKNNHPLFSICLAKRGQPYNTKKRLIVFICITSFAIGLAYILVNTSYIHQITVCRDGCKVSQNVVSKICDGGFNDGLKYANFEGQCAYYQPWMLSAVCGAVLVPYGTLLSFCATCGCVQGRAFFNDHFCGKRIRKLLECCGGEILLLFLVISLAIITWTLLEAYIRGSGYSFFTVILISKVWSLGIWFLWSTPFFCYRYPKDKKYFEANNQSDKIPKTTEV